MRRIYKKLRYLLWRFCNPTKKFHDYYVLEVQKKISRAGSHETLSINARNPDRYDQTAELEVDFLKKYGLEKHHRVVDYGCGSLRLGQKLIPWLNPGNYIGLDVTDQFFKEGLSALSASDQESVFGNLAVVADKTIQEFSSNPSDYLISTAVYYHIPKSEMYSFFDKVLSLLSTGGQAFIDFSISDQYIQTGNMTWAITEAIIREALEPFDVTIAILKPETLLASGYYNENHRLLRIIKNK